MSDLLILGILFVVCPTIGFFLGSRLSPTSTVTALRANLREMTANYEAMFEARYQAGYEAGLVQGMAEQREITRAGHVVRGQKAWQTRKQRQEAA